MVVGYLAHPFFVEEEANDQADHLMVRVNLAQGHPEHQILLATFPFPDRFGAPFSPCMDICFVILSFYILSRYVNQYNIVFLTSTPTLTCKLTSNAIRKLQNMFCVAFGSSPS